MVIKQLTILFFISFLSELISSLLPFTFPASLMAIIILFILLYSKLLGMKNIETVGEFLQKHIAIFFIPPAISLMDEFPYIKDKLIPILFITVVSFLLTFLSTAYTVKIVIKIQERIQKNGTNLK
ncbi:CidA/LrgA family protein [uncultured Tyzzerella sp.]|uniref:CidA/LrgA family protein n=1 Tax=uncultured Tyzzerella sp. TaxID=2321398 RepID=UPI0029438480|nr:CidA/LrgA family protein [uncultured Tyzzerella sp.]